MQENKLRRIKVPMTRHLFLHFLTDNCILNRFVFKGDRYKCRLCEDFEKCAYSFKKRKNGKHNKITISFFEKRQTAFLKRGKLSPQKQLKD